MKRAFDICVSAAGMVLLLPLALVIAIAIVADSGRPVFFSQVRVGRAFRKFRIWKFQSMRSAPGASVTASTDPRITRVGRFLRATKLDELPQLVNVLLGDMSLVGPRPESVQYVYLFRDEYAHLLQVRPGLTDPASITFRDEERILAMSGDAASCYRTRVLPEKIRLSREYVDSRSFTGDLKLLFHTFVALAVGGRA